jgi:hypothetical protein
LAVGGDDIFAGRVFLGAKDTRDGRDENAFYI